ncbi:MAG: hypothetical protein GTO00_05915 [Deltaproteobacteria bacterium]|nr:hypothetical protein [Deltaproteobacteria bacterium]
MAVAMTAALSHAYQSRTNSSGANAGTGDTSSQVRMVKHCLTTGNSIEEDRDLVEASKVAQAFPLYGSREEKVFRPGATIISYNGNVDFKLGKAFRTAKKEPERECIFIQESERP